ncbi:MAG: S53 family peptidase [Fimbriimonadaceae bacterium]
MAIGAQAQTYYQGNPNIVVPPSSIPHPGQFHTHLLIYVGPGSALPNGGLLRGPSMFASGPQGYHPADIQAAYKMPSTGGSNAIAIVDAYDLPTALSDFNMFSSTFGLPTESSSSATSSSNKHFQVVYAQGSQPSGTYWADEEALDIEWAHAMAPNAKIYLVEAADASYGSLLAAETTAAKLVGVREVSNSWGGGEFSGEVNDDSTFVQNGVVFFASAGDVGGAQSYPAESPNVVGVGGTSLYMSGTTVTSETVWGGTGGGPSSVEPRPPYQLVVQGIVGTARGCPDIAAVADPNTGVAVYSATTGGWFVVGGTSVACPVTAGITNTRGSFTASSALELSRVYKNLGSRFYRDIVTGSAGSFSGMVGWDFCTGVGCPVGLYPTQIANGINPSSVSVLNGTLESGTLSSLFAVDGNTYNVASALVGNVGQASTIVVTFNLGSPSSTLSSALIGLTETAPPGSTVQIFAYNWTTKSYEIVQAFPGVGSAPQDTATLNNLSKYENASSVIKLAIRTFIPIRLGSIGFTAATDQVTVQTVGSI